MGVLRARARKPIRILVLGFPYFVDRLRELGQSREFVFLAMPQGFFRRWWTLFRTDVIYLIGGDLRPNRYYGIALLWRKKIIMHWVGSDILEMKKIKENGGFLFPPFIKQITHWAEVDWTAAELAGLGVSARVVPLTPAGYPENVKDLPAKFVALSYLPPGKEDFYGAPWVMRLAADFPEIVFLIAAASPQDKKDQWPENMIPIGWVNDMSELYGEITVLIRLTQHDGLSFMVLEALAQARHVIWSYPLPGAGRARDYQELREQIETLYQEFQDGKLVPNWRGREAVTLEYGPPAVWERIRAGITALLAE